MKKIRGNTVSLVRIAVARMRQITCIRSDRRQRHPLHLALSNRLAWLDDRHLGNGAGLAEFRLYPGVI